MRIRTAGAGRDRTPTLWVGFTGPVLALLLHRVRGARAPMVAAMAAGESQ